MNRVNTASNGTPGQCSRTSTEAGAVSSCKKSGNSCRLEQGRAVDQHHMASNAKTWRRGGQGDGLIKRGSICHQGGRSNDTFEVGLQDGGIYSGRKSEIVGVDDESSHRGSLTGAQRYRAAGNYLAIEQSGQWFDRCFGAHVYSKKNCSSAPSFCEQLPNKIKRTGVRGG